MDINTSGVDAPEAGMDEIADRPVDRHRGDAEAKWARRRDIIVTLVGWGIAISFTGWLLGFIIDAIVIVAFAVVIALILLPLARLFARVMPWGPAVLCTYVVALIVVVGFGYWVVINLSVDISELVHRIPIYKAEFQDLLTRVQTFLNQRGVHVNLDATAIGNALFSQISSSSAQILSAVAGVVGIVAGIFTGMVLAIVISIYLVIDGPRAVRMLGEIVPLSQRMRVARFQRILNRVLTGYIRGQLTLAVLVGLLVGIGMFLLGVPYATILGVFAFFFEFVPILGVIASGALCVIFALTVSPLLALWVLLYFAGVHVFEGDVVGPRIVGNAVGLHPALSIMALIAGAEVGGLLGALFAVPIAGSLQALALAIYDEVKPSGALALATAARPRMGEQSALLRRFSQGPGSKLLSVATWSQRRLAATGWWVIATLRAVWRLGRLADRGADAGGMRSEPMSGESEGREGSPGENRGQENRVQ
jgi:predicted PurR-regulated permease PerM